MFIAKLKLAELRPGFAIAGIGLLLTLPVILYGAFDAMDLPFHLKWSKHFAEQFWMGDLYPRWLQQMNLGFGSPAFFFYAPVPYYVISFLHPLFVNDAQSWLQLSWSAAIALIASGFTAYLWLNTMTTRTAALIGAIAYMMLPYHLAVNLYWRFAFAEYWALVWLPLILYFSRNLIHRFKINFIGTAVSYALLVMTHLPTLVMFSPVPFFYVLVLTNRVQRWKSLLRLVLAMMLGIALAAIYWLPAMTTQKFISMTAILEKGYFYGNNFLFSKQAVLYHTASLWFYLQLIVVFMLGLAICAFGILPKNLSAGLKRESYFWLIVAITTFFMMLPVSTLIWKLLPPLQRIQFPWRLNTVLLVAVTALLTLAVHTLQLSFATLSERSIGQKRNDKNITNRLLTFWKNAKPRQKVTLAIGLALMVSLLLSNGIVMKQRLKPRPNFNVAQELEMSVEEALEYRPRWVAPELFQINGLQQLSQRFPSGRLTAEPDNVSILKWQPREIIFRSPASRTAQLTFKQFYYPGWTAQYTRDHSHHLVVQPSSPAGLLTVELPPESSDIELTFNAGVEERAGQLVSAIALLIVGLIGFRSATLPTIKASRSYVQSSAD